MTVSALQCSAALMPFWFLDREWCGPCGGKILDISVGAIVGGAAQCPVWGLCNPRPGPTNKILCNMDQKNGFAYIPKPSLAPPNSFLWPIGTFEKDYKHIFL